MWFSAEIFHMYLSFRNRHIIHFIFNILYMCVCMYVYSRGYYKALSYSNTNFLNLCICVQRLQMVCLLRHLYIAAYIHYNSLLLPRKNKETKYMLFQSMGIDNSFRPRLFSCSGAGVLIEPHSFSVKKSKSHDN